MGKLLLTLVVLLSASLVRAATVPISGWLVHNGTSTVGGTADNPTFTPGSNLTLMAPFSDVTLANDGEYVEITTTLTLNNRTANTGVNALNTQLRLGIFDNNTSPTLAAGDAPNVGFTMEYTNTAAGGLIREQQSAVQTNPFTSPTTIGNGAQDSGADSIQGANPGPVVFDLKLTRNGGKIDYAGFISGTDSVSGNPYLANFTTSGYSSANFPADGAFTFNRIGLFLGPNVSATSAALANSSVTFGVVPEPTSVALLSSAMLGFLVKRRSR